jgi:hypothetical protein
MNNNEALQSTDTLELVDRYNNLIKKYVELSVELAPKIEKFGKYRNELQILSAEFVRRGFKVDEPEGLKKLLEEEIKKRENK